MIDAHTHIGRVKSWSRRLRGTVETGLRDLLEYVEGEKLEKVVLLPVARSYPDIGEDIVKTDSVLEAYSLHPDKIIPFCAFNPEDGGLREKIREAVRSGCRGFGEHKVEIRINAEQNINLFRICGEYGLPVLIHIDSRFNPDFEGFKDVVSRVEETFFIVHGPGWWAQISSEQTGEVYPNGRISEPGEAVRILKEYRNVYADISAFSGLNAISRDREFGRRFLSEMSGKLIYGTDFPCINPEGSQFGPDRSHISLLESYNLEEEVLNKITRENILKILKHD
ncbi:MAG: amidohydrolase family protein [Crenarchaeota archaeon]|nr:amidohydrolase family protein [Thermoproteota archaeon]